MNSYPSSVILYGGTGQAKLVRPIIEHSNSRVIAVFDDTPNLPSPFNDVPIYEGWEGFLRWKATCPSEFVGFCVTIGNPHGRVRLMLHDRLQAQGLIPVTVVHPNAWIAESAEIGVGSQIMAGAVIQPEVRVGKQCIVNSLSYLDHEATLGDGCELASGGRIMGHSQIGTNTFIGVNGVVLSRLCVGSDVRISAGTIVTGNVADGTTISGITSREQ